MKFKLEDHIPDIPSLNKKIPKYYDLLAFLITLPELGNVWYLAKSALSSSLNGFQYSIRTKEGHIPAAQYPQNSYLIINSQTKKYSVVRSIMLTYKQDQILAKRKSVGNVPVWELLDKELIRTYKDIQFLLHFEVNFYADCFEKETAVVKHQTLRRTIPLNKKFQQTTPSSEPVKDKVNIIKYESTYAIPLFHRYFSLEDTALNWVDINTIERYKVKNTNMNEIFAIGTILNAIQKDGFDLEKEVGIVTLTEEQKHIIADFYSETIGHESSRPKIGLPSEMSDKKFNVILFSTVMSTKLEKPPCFEKEEQHIRLIIDNAKDGMIFVGNHRAVHSVFGFPKEISGLIKTLRNVSKITSWASSDYAEEQIKIWKEPIKKMYPDRTSEQTQKILWGKYHKNIQLEFERKNIVGMKSIYRDYLRTLGIGKKKETN